MSSRLRQLLIGVLLTGLLLAVAAPAGAGEKRAGRSIAAANGLEYQVLAEVNSVRARHRLRPLRLSTALSTAADRHSREMARLGYFSHNSADGSPFWKRIKRYYGMGDYGFWSVGENLLWASPTIDASDAVERWMKSPKHRANLLKPRWRQIGLAAVQAASAPKTFSGRDVTILTAEFGVRQ